jgi:hypothetical protein
MNTRMLGTVMRSAMPHAPGAMAVLLVTAIAACDSRVPSGPSQLPPIYRDSTSTGPVISGRVMDTALRPVVGARVEVVNGAHAGLSTTTDASGRYLLNGPFESPTGVRASKDGYAVMNKVWTCFTTTCNQNPGPLVDFALTGLTSPVDIAGNYAITLSADLACTDLPAVARSRTYTASISRASHAAHNTPMFTLDLAGATFHELGGGYLLDGLSAAPAGNDVVFFFGSSDAPAVVEQVALHTYIKFSGDASATVVSGSSTIAATLDGEIEFCALQDPMEPGWRCREDQLVAPVPGLPVAHARCDATNHRMVLTRQP